MKKRLLAFLKENKKKILFFVVSGVCAACGIAADPEIITAVMAAFGC